MILITGGKGFIGTTLRNHLDSISEPYVYCDLFISSDEGYIRCDVANTMEMAERIPWKKIHFVIHLAAECGIINCENHVLKSEYSNILGTTIICSLCAKHDIPLMYLSTSEVYGNDLIMDDCVRLYIDQPRNHYALQKLMGEEIVKRYTDNYYIIRPFMLYGIHESYNEYRSSLIQFINHAIKNEEITVHRNSYRSWMNVRGFCEALTHLYGTGKYGTYNVGTRDPILSMEELAQMIIELSGSKSHINIIPPPNIRIQYKRPLLDKLNATGYHYDYDFNKDLREMVDYIKMSYAT